MAHKSWKLRILSICGLSLSLINISTTATYFASLSNSETNSTSGYLFKNQRIGFHLAFLTLASDCVISVICFLLCWMFHFRPQNYTYSTRLLISYAILIALKGIFGIASHIQDELSFPKQEIINDCHSNSKNSDNSCSLLTNRKIFISLFYITFILGGAILGALRYLYVFYCIPDNNKLMDFSAKNNMQTDVVIDLQKPLQSVYNEFKIRKMVLDNSNSAKSIQKNSQNDISNSVLHISQFQTKNDPDISIQRHLEQINRFVGEAPFQENNFRNDSNGERTSHNSKKIPKSGPRANRAYGVDIPSQIDETKSNNNQNQLENQSANQNTSSKATKQVCDPSSQNNKERNPLQSQNSIRSKQISSYKSRISNFSWVSQSQFGSNPSMINSFTVQGLNFSQQLSDSKRGSNLNMFKGIDCPPSPIKKAKFKSENKNLNEQSDCFDESSNYESNQEKIGTQIKLKQLITPVQRSTSLQMQINQKNEKMYISEESSDEDQKDQSSAFESSVNDMKEELTGQLRKLSKQFA